MIIVYGMTKCRICREVINEGDRIVTIPSIVDRSIANSMFSVMLRYITGVLTRIR
jgi:hypothetical protein